jgi:hypothetical protein
MTSSRIEFSSVLAPSANRATSSNVDPVVVVVVTVVTAAVEDDEDAAALDAFALDLLNAARAYSTASKLPETAFAPAFVVVVVVVVVDVCAPDPRNNCLNVSLALSVVVVVVDPSASSLPLPCCKSNVDDADADVAVVPLRNGSSSGCASATRLSCSIISAESRPVASSAE